MPRVEYFNFGLVDELRKQQSDTSKEVDVLKQKATTNDNTDNLQQTALGDLDSFTDAVAAGLIKEVVETGKLAIENTEEHDQFKRDHVSLVNHLKTTDKKLKDTSDSISEMQDAATLLTYASWSQFEYVTELNRLTWQSGVIRARKYEYTGPDAYHQPTSTGYTPYNGHDHGNIQNLVGTGEFSVMANGIMCRLRHNDDGLWKHANVGEDFNIRQVILPPDTPADVLACATPTEQIELAKKYIKVMAGELPSDSVGNYKDSAQWVMTGIEVYPEVYTLGKDLRDPFAGHRHQINVSSIPELFHQEAFYNNGGHKNIRENSLGIAMAVNDVDANGNPVTVLWRYRFISAVVGDLEEYPIDDIIQYKEDMANSYRFNVTDHVRFQQQRECRFSLKQVAKKSDNNIPVYQPTVIDKFISNIPGLDGYGNTLTETYQYYGASDQLKEFGNPTVPLKAGYYNRWYTMSGNDASNRTNAMRSFSDDKLWVARTTDPRIKQTQFGNEKYGFSYFIPLELHIQSFLNGNFNPYGLTDINSTYSVATLQDMVEVQGYGRSQTKPLPGYNNYYYYYKNPADIFSNNVPRDPADTTVNGGLWITCADGIARKHFPSGYGYFYPTDGVIGEALRTRYPIYFSHYEGSEAHKYIEAARKEIEDLTSLYISDMVKQTKDFLLNEKRIKTIERSISNNKVASQHSVDLSHRTLLNYVDNNLSDLTENDMSQMAHSLQNSMDHVKLTDSSNKQQARLNETNSVLDNVRNELAVMYRTIIVTTPNVIMSMSSQSTGDQDTQPVTIYSLTDSVTLMSSIDPATVVNYVWEYPDGSVHDGSLSLTNNTSIPGRYAGYAIDTYGNKSLPTYVTL